MFNFPSVFRTDCRLKCKAAVDHCSCMAMVLSLDSLGQCVSALSKRFTAAESIRESAVSCLPHSHREKHSEVRHRKDTHHQQEDEPKTKVALATPAGLFSNVTPDTSSLFAKDLCLPAVCCWSLKCTCVYAYPELCLMQVTNGKVPTSILKRKSHSYGSDTEPNHRRKGERRVRFREPETTVHGEETVQTACNKTSLTIRRLYNNREQEGPQHVTAVCAVHSAVKRKSKMH